MPRPLILRGVAHAIRSRFSAKLFIVVAASIVLPASALFSTGLALFEGAVRESINAELRSSLEKAERDLTSFLADLVAVSNAAVNADGILEALVSDRPAYELARQVDGSFEVILATLPGRETIKYTLIGNSRLFSSWSRNLRDYGSLRGLKVVERAARGGGHVVWQGLSPTYVLDEIGARFLVTIARAVGPEAIPEPGVLLLHADSQALRRYLRDRRTSASFATLLIAEGSLVVDASASEVPASIAREIVALAGSSGGASAGDSVFEAHLGNYLCAGRVLEGLPDELKAQGWNIAVLFDYEGLQRRFSRLRTLFAPSFAALLALAFGASFFASRRMVLPLARLAGDMEVWDPGAAPVRPLDREDEIGTLSRSFERMQKKISELFSSLQREHEIRELYRYRALRAQLNPHFLFNSLASIRWMAIIRRADNIVQALDALSGLLSYSMGKKGDHSTLREELDSVRSYISVQNLRFGGRFSLDCSVSPELADSRVLRFMLQPLVENCLIHAYRGMDGAGVIEIGAALEGGDLVIEVSDSGKGPGSLPKDVPSSPDAETGLGLANVRDMLVITYGSGAGLDLLEREGGGAVARIRIPRDGEP